jgi:prepilin-type N-terminal cleavage/methylation domain-containing protein
MTKSKNRVQRMKSTDKGFTLIELVVVMAMIIVVTALSLPSIMNSINAVRLRSQAQGLAGLFQQVRIQAARDNNIYGLGCTPQSNGIDSCTQVFLVARDGATQLPNSPMLQYAQNLSFSSVGPAVALSNATLGFALVPAGNSTQPFFNQRGLPCTMAGGVCSTTTPAGRVGFAYYLKMQNGIGGTNWAAVSVSPSGRIKVWTYDGKVTWQ